eukprot:CAMPEP_0197404954 /NCGR_PEP_ID=MMETSP1165-20131217/23658_1 /TAXON_ID=284809 /ORGANISM="Chrysocystis fragilis, Strain CCMP3189" /LENGTH=81 /DNA_ID=CAMNT_0042931251 /DNA_START=154 /DNA_END=396 /DNA_ORIENTATION=-
MCCLLLGTSDTREFVQRCRVCTGLTSFVHLPTGDEKGDIRRHRVLDSTAKKRGHNISVNPIHCIKANGQFPSDASGLWNRQ